MMNTHTVELRQVVSAGCARVLVVTPICDSDLEYLSTDPYSGGSP